MNEREQVDKFMHGPFGEILELSSNTKGREVVLCRKQDQNQKKLLLVDQGFFSKLKSIDSTKTRTKSGVEGTGPE